MFIKNIFKVHGFPEKIISDRGPQFVSKFWSTVFESADSKRTFQTLEQYLRCFIKKRTEQLG